MAYYGIKCSFNYTKYIQLLGRFTLDLCDGIDI